MILLLKLIKRQEYLNGKSRLNCNYLTERYEGYGIALEEL